MAKKSGAVSSLDLARCAFFCVLIIVGAFVKVPIPVLPFTLAFLMTSLAGLLLGSKWGAASVALYVALGLFGLPVFVGGGGLGYVMQPTFGYLIGYIAATWLTGVIAPPVRKTTYRRRLIACFSGLVVLYAIGMAYLYLLSNYVLGAPIAFDALVLYCFVLSAPGDIVLCFAAASLAKRLLPIANRTNMSRKKAIASSEATSAPAGRVRGLTKEELR